MDISSEIYESSDMVSLPAREASLFFRACLLEGVWKQKMLHCYVWLAFKELHPGTDWRLPFAKLFSAVPKMKTEQLWRCNSIKRAYLINLVSRLKCFWSHYPNHLLSRDSSSATQLRFAFAAHQQELPSREQSQPLSEGLPGTHRSAREKIICLKPWGYADAQLWHMAAAWN